jgi:hypothetical protein
MFPKSLPASEVEVDRRTSTGKMCEPQPFLRARSTLLSRLAEAVDGNRKGEGVVYVAEYWYRPTRKGHEVHGPFPNCEEAASFRANKLSDDDGKQYGIFGPFWTEEAPGDTVSTDGQGPFVTRVVVHLSDSQTLEFLPKDVDAVFWSRAAVQKFVVPYYTGIGSIKEGATIEQGLNAGVVLVHRPGSEWEVDQPGILLNGKPLTPDAGIGSLMIKVEPKAPDSITGDLVAVPLF